MLKVCNINSRKRSKICSKETIKTLEQRLIEISKKTLDFTSYFTSISKVLICCHFEQVNKCLLKGQGPLTSFWCFYG